jgi:hypothetical protein
MAPLAAIGETGIGGSPELRLCPILLAFCTIAAQRMPARR